MPAAVRDNAPDPLPRRRSSWGSAWRSLPLWVVVPAVAAIVTWGLVRCALWTRDHFDPFAPETTDEGVRRILAENPIPRGAPAAPDPDAVLAALAARFPVEMAAARAVHVLPDAAGDAHGLFAAYLAGLHAIDPGLAPEHDGTHRHLPPPPLIDIVGWLRSHLLARDLLAVLDELPGGDAHDETDRQILRAHLLDLAVHHVGSDADVLRTVNAWFDPLFPLTAFDCCDVDARAAVAAEHLARTPDDLRAALDELSSPPRPLVLATAELCEDAAAYLADYPGEWPSDVAARLAGPARVASAAAAEAARRLREDIAPRSHLRLGIGRDGVARRLQLLHRLERTPERLLRVAADVLAADPEYRHDDTTSQPGAPRSAAELLEELRSGTADSVPPVGEDSGLRLAPVPRLWARDMGGAFHVSAPRDALPDLVLVPEPQTHDGQDDWERTSEYLTLRHTIAHETYPGHHLQDEAAERTCRLRRELAEAFAVEGWAAYCEELLHEIGACDGSAADDWVLYLDRTWYAQLAVCSVAIQSGFAGHHDVQDWMNTNGLPYTEAAVGAIAMNGLYAAGYLFGRLEIESFREEEEQRLGARFDLAEFHRRLLAAGPIPIPLLRRELAAERR